MKIMWNAISIGKKIKKNKNMPYFSFQTKAKEEKNHIKYNEYYFQ